jgi:DNA-binding NarL/FixJ family response regulator
MSIRLAAIDSIALVRLGIAHAVAECPDIEFVAEAGTATEARRLIPGLDVTVVTVDSSLPDADGLALARELREQQPGLGVVVLSVADDALLFRALHTGMSAFVPRSAPATEVVAGIRHAAVASGSFSTLGLADALTRRQSRAALLSPRELEVLRLMRVGASAPQMAAALMVSESTVKTYVARIYTKLHVNNRSQAIMAAARRGLLTESDLRLASTF